MNKLLLPCFLATLLFSCKKEAPFDPDEHVTYKHWYKMDGSADTLYSVYFANCFSPNGDGVNDDFLPAGNFQLEHFYVFDRNDNVIYETSDKNKYWDGRIMHGPTVECNTYRYRIIVKDRFGVEYEYWGGVMVYS